METEEDSFLSASSPPSFSPLYPVFIFSVGLALYYASSKEPTSVYGSSLSFFPFAVSNLRI
jgi:hypothetical protein